MFHQSCSTILRVTPALTLDPPISTCPWLRSGPLACHIVTFTPTLLSTQVRSTPAADTQVIFYCGGRFFLTISVHASASCVARFRFLVSRAAARCAAGPRGAPCRRLPPARRAPGPWWRGVSGHVEDREDDAGHRARLLALLGPFLQRPAVGRLGPRPTSEW